jgi:hypothetical protein
MQIDAHHSVHEEFWNFGHELFRSAPETFPVWFLAGDIFDRSCLATYILDRLNEVSKRQQGRLNPFQSGSGCGLLD